MVVLKSFRNIFFISELRKRLMFTLGVLAVYRLGTMIPIIGVNIARLSLYMQQASGVGFLFNYLDRFSGGALANCTVFALGITPYITASIAMQLLAMSVPSLMALQKEGEYGRQLINQYTRYLTLGLGVIYSMSYATLLEVNDLVLSPGWGFRLMFVVSMTAGAMFVMWLGEQISIFGIGNGASVLIFAGILARLPEGVNQTIQYIGMGTTNLITVGIVILIMLVIVACIVYLEKGERKIPIQYARRIIGNRVFGGQSSYIPFKINPVGVMPVIFANSAMHLPMVVINMMAARFESLKFLSGAFSNSVWFNAVDFVLIIFFTFLYAALVFNPDELADNIKKNGGFIAGIRPGKKTAQYFDYILNRIGLVGAIYLACLAIAPNIITRIANVPLVLGGTSLLIVVGVALEIAAQMETYLIEHHYEGFLLNGRMKGRARR